MAGAVPTRDDALAALHTIASTRRFRRVSSRDVAVAIGADQRATATVLAELAGGPSPALTELWLLATEPEGETLAEFTREERPELGSEFDHPLLFEPLVLSRSDFVLLYVPRAPAATALVGPTSAREALRRRARRVR